MKIVTLTPPGRFPTMVPDPGSWWGYLAAGGEHELFRFSANYTWWKVLCSPSTARACLAGLSLPQRLRRGVEWKAAGLDLERTSRAAGRALDDLCTPGPYQSPSRYVRAIEPLSDHLAALNQAQRELRITLGDGPCVAGLDYDRSAVLREYSRQDTFLSRLIQAALCQCPRGIGLLAVRATSAKDLLSAMIAVELLRCENPGMHACLVDHGYENFSLRPYLAELQDAATLTTVFDTIIASRDERDEIVPLLAAMVAGGRAPKGIVRRADLPDVPARAEPSRYVPPPPQPSFCPAPVFWTRVSQRRCYWGRCAFCVQNHKHEDPRLPTLSDVPEALDRIEALLAAGYHTMIFSDEALEPPLLKRFCQGVIERRLSFRWACRCRLESALDDELFRLMRQAGCFELLCGLEAVSTRMQMRMCKYAAGVDKPWIRQVLQGLDRAGLGVHVNLIANFPGDTPAELQESVDFLAAEMRGLGRATLTLNRFAMFADTPIANDPQAFGVARVFAAGDMPGSYEYQLTPELAADSEEIDRLLPAVRQSLLTRLGWGNLGSGPAAEAALELYFESGHGSFFKTQEADPFAGLLAGQAVAEAVP